MKKLYWLLIVFLVLLSGCSSNEHEHEAMPSAVPIAVDLIITPESIDTNVPVTFTATVTQGDEKVEDASEVMFEIWKNGEENHEMLAGTHQGEGRYSIEKSFEQSGVYFVVSHVTARNMHAMPKKEFTVGHVENTEQTEEEGTASHEESHHHHDSASESTHEHGHSNVTVDLLWGEKANDEIVANREMTLMAHVKNNDTPLSGAIVQFEIWKDGDEKHLYINATEMGQHYEAIITFDVAGTYTVRTHVMKDDIHDHIETTVTVVNP